MKGALKMFLSIFQVRVLFQGRGVTQIAFWAHLQWRLAICQSFLFFFQVFNCCFQQLGSPQQFLIDCLLWLKFLSYSICNLISILDSLDIGIGEGRDRMLVAVKMETVATIPVIWRPRNLYGLFVLYFCKLSIS